jgi:hypothetical protein
VLQSDLSEASALLVVAALRWKLRFVPNPVVSVEDSVSFMRRATVGVAGEQVWRVLIGGTCAHEWYRCERTRGYCDCAAPRQRNVLKHAEQLLVVVLHESMEYLDSAPVFGASSPAICASDAACTFEENSATCKGAGVTRHARVERPVRLCRSWPSCLR